MLKWILIIGGGLLILAMLFPFIILGSWVSDIASDERESLQRDAQNYEAMLDRLPDYCVRLSSRSKTQTLTKAQCSCFLEKNLAWTPLPKDKALGVTIRSHVKKDSKNLELPQSVLEDTFFRGNVSATIAAVKRKAITRNDKALLVALLENEEDIQKSLETKIHKAGFSMCISNKDINDLNIMAQTNRHTSAVELMNKRLSKVRALRAE